MGSYRSDGVIYHNSKYFGTTNQGYGCNDVITLSINPFNERISFHKNGCLIVSQKYSTNSKGSYKLAISLFHKHDSVSIINEHETLIDSGTRDTQSDVTQEIISALLDNNNVLSTELDL
eukprot:TRINITY_DN1069_c0_g1_i1.p1 TRINITY_DN1069_c0_g1~~TRINITY_DN1069_c0_g1_i1.p1  ORF type:complete len:119 (-),score=11.73 TRINITY_DN1069_c0_g1_i1:20-376(-)